jgi:hypothetical protein
VILLLAVKCNSANIFVKVKYDLWRNINTYLLKRRINFQKLSICNAESCQTKPCSLYIGKIVQCERLE